MRTRQWCGHFSVHTVPVCEHANDWLISVFIQYRYANTPTTGWFQCAYSLIMRTRQRLVGFSVHNYSPSIRTRHHLVYFSEHRVPIYEHANNWLHSCYKYKIIVIVKKTVIHYRRCVLPRDVSGYQLMCILLTPCDDNYILRIYIYMKYEVHHPVDADVRTRIIHIMLMLTCPMCKGRHQKV